MITNFTYLLRLYPWLATLAVAAALVGLFLLIAITGRNKLFYVLSACVPLAWLLAPLMLRGAEYRADDGLMSAVIQALRADMALWYWMPIGLLFCVLFAVIWRPPSKHKNGELLPDTSPDVGVIEQQKPVWLIFGIVMLGLTIWYAQLFIEAERRMQGLRVVTRSLIHAIEETHFYAGQLVDESEALGATQTPTATLLQAIDAVDEKRAFVGDLIADAHSLMLIQSPTSTVVIEQQRESLRQAELLIAILDRNADTMRDRLNASPQATAAEMKFLAGEIYDETGDLLLVAAVLEPDRITPLTVTLILMSVFMLFPWVLYFSFIVGKRSILIQNSRQTLADLDLLERAIESSGTRVETQDQYDRSIAIQLLEATRSYADRQHLINFKAYLLRICAAESRDSSLTSILAQLKKAINDSGNAPEEVAWRDIRTKAKLAADRAIEVVLEQRTFFSREYIIPLIILTIFTAVGWYYIFMPNMLSGLVDLMLDGATIKTITAYLTNEFTPVTMSFAGAWLFITVMLTYRWVQDDLYPRSFFYATVRLVVAFLIGLIFKSTSDVLTIVSDEALLLLAFAVGAFPLEWVRGILRWISRLPIRIRHGVEGLFGGETLPAFNVPDIGSQQPLTLLEDLTIWDDTRLFQEGIENVHGLATADLDELVLNTPYAANTLMDWVDEAILRLHAGQQWYPGLQVVGIRRATQLMDRVSSPDASGNSDKRDLSGLAGLIAASNDAQAVALGMGGSRWQAYKAASELSDLAAALTEAAKLAVVPSADVLDGLKKTWGDQVLGARIKAIDTNQQGLLDRLALLPDAYAVALAKKAATQTTQAISAAEAGRAAAEKAIMALNAGDAAGIDEARNSVLAGCDALVALANQVKRCVEAVVAATVPHRLSQEVLPVIVNACLRDPNAQRLRLFWNRRAPVFVSSAVPDSQSNVVKGLVTSSMAVT